MTKIIFAKKRRGISLTKTVGTKLFNQQKLRSKVRRAPLRKLNANRMGIAESVSSSDLEILKILKSSACRKHPGKGCILNFFENEYDVITDRCTQQACEFFRCCRHKVQHLSVEETANFIAGEFQKCVQKMMGRNKDCTIYTWKLLHKIPACRECFVSAFDTTLYFVKKLGKAFKSSKDGIIDIRNLNHRMWKDDHLHNLSFAEVDRATQEVLGHAGTYLSIFIFISLLNIV